MLEETAEERENRLAKRREAWKKRTAEVKGKQKEFQRAYRQQKEAAESTEERESRLAKRREVLQERTTEAKSKEKENKRVCRQQKKAAESTEERETRLEKRRKAWQEKTGEAKGKEKEYQRAHYVDKKQNETEAERTNRLQKRREKRASKILDEQERIQEILRAHFHTATANGEEQRDRLAENEGREEVSNALVLETDEGNLPFVDAKDASLLVYNEASEECVPLHEANGMLSEPVREVNDNLNVSVNQKIDRSVPEADEEGMSVHEAGCPVVSRNEYLHQGGWQNVDNPLHEQEFVLK